MSGTPISHFDLGASLYVPALHPDPLAIANGQKHGHLRSVIFCTEDSIRADQLEQALKRLETALPKFDDARVRRFIRVRNPHVMGRLLTADGIANIDGFVIPKATTETLPAYMNLLGERDPFVLMPTLETAEAYDAHEMRQLQRWMSDHKLRNRILALRVGGNDLLNAIGVRRSCARTIYETPVGQVIAKLVGTFKPHGFELTAPVFEGMAHADVLAREIEMDLDHGLFGKTAIHPDQVPLIERHYEVCARDLEMAEAMLKENAPAVFRMHDTMCEAATHARWARLIVERGQRYGIKGVSAGVLKVA